MWYNKEGTQFGEGGPHHFFGHKVLSTLIGKVRHQTIILGLKKAEVGLLGFFGSCKRQRQFSCSGDSKQDSPLKSGFAVNFVGMFQCL